MRISFPIQFLLLGTLGLQMVGCNDQPAEKDFVPVADVQSQIPERFALGSCSRENLPQPLWPEILHKEPGLFIWLGDNIYGDSEDMAVMEEKYTIQKSHPDYQKLRAKVPIVGTWDDHDFGLNDGGKEFGPRAESQQLALDFLDVPANAPVREQEGMYQVFDFGEGDRMVRLILLDSRYHRDTLAPSTNPDWRFGVNATGDMLGEAQWQWLREQLEDSPAKVHLIGSSVQFLAEEHGFEKWANLPMARQRMIDLLVETKAANPIFLSGDRHIAELSKMEVEGLAWPIYDFTCSGLTHTWSEFWEESNSYRVGDLIIGLNYGLIDFDWEASTLDLEVWGPQDSLYASYPISLK